MAGWAAAAASVALFTWALVMFRGHMPMVRVSPQPFKSAPASERLLDIAVQDHVRRAASLLTRIEDQPQQAAKGTERAAINNLVAENRLYRQTAEQENDRSTAQLLGDLETALVVLKHDPTRLPVSDVRELKQRLIVAGRASTLGFFYISDSTNAQLKRDPL
jgi:hypothetical protein